MLTQYEMEAGTVDPVKEQQGGSVGGGTSHQARPELDPGTYLVEGRPDSRDLCSVLHTYVRGTHQLTKKNLV